MTAGNDETGIDQVRGPRRVHGIVPSAHARLIVLGDTPRRAAASATVRWSIIGSTLTEVVGRAQSALQTECGKY